MAVLRFAAQNHRKGDSTFAVVPTNISICNS
nr:MAG TPA: hypothetical protein [Caudoviricetes sp.]